MSTLYELTADFMMLLEMAEDPDTDPEALQDTMEALSMDIEDKADGYAKVIRQMEADAAACDAEAKRLRNKKLTMEARIKHMKENLQDAMEVTGERKFKDPGDFTPSHTVVLYTNHLPRVGASDSGTWRRLIVIPFNASFTGKSDVKNYADFLVENAGPAILSWVIEGARSVIEKGFHLERPQVVTDAIEAYKAGNDWMSSFLEDCCELGAFTEKSGELYIQYRAYCDRIGEFTRSTTEFYTELSNRGYEKKKTNTGSIVSGLRLKMNDFLD